MHSRKRDEMFSDNEIRGCVVILILCQPRTGSSLITKIVHEHGCWIGQIKEKPNTHDYTHYENEPLSNILKEINILFWKGKEKIYGGLDMDGKIYRQKLKTMIDHLKPLDPWVFKCSVDYARLFYQFDPKIILIKRDEEQCILSTIEKGRRRAKTEAREIYRKRMSSMKKVEKERGAVWIDVDEVMAGEYASLKEAIEYCGLEFNQETTEKAIDPSKWHKR